MNFEEHGNDDPFPFPSVFRHIPVLDVCVEVVGSIKQRGRDLPIGNAVSFFQQVMVVDEDCSLVQQALDFFAQFAKVIIANADSTTVP